ncbi:MAG: hypothetical protein R3A48_24350 [Polyangiales bacterium]
MSDKWLAKHAHWGDRVGLVYLGGLPMRAAYRAMRRSLPTMDHAARVFEAAMRLLGESVWTDPEGGADRRRVHRVDAEDRRWLFPQPSLEHAWGGGTGASKGGLFRNTAFPPPVDAPPGWTYDDPPFDPGDPRPQVAPRGASMRAGSLAIRQGPARFEIVYDAEGLIEECRTSGSDFYTSALYDGVRPFAIDPQARPPTTPPVSALTDPRLVAEGVSVETLAQMLADMEPSASRARVRLPTPVPGGAVGVWTVALRAIRRAIWDGAVPDDAGWVIADGFEGSAVATGDTPESTWEAFQRALFRERLRPPSAAPPTPPSPPPPRSLEDAVSSQSAAAANDASARVTLLLAQSITVTGTSRGASLAWPAPTPANTPAGRLPLPPLPAVPAAYEAAGFTRWLRVPVDGGEVRHALLRQEPDGWTLVGDGVLDAVIPSQIPDDLARGRRERDEDYAGLPLEHRPWDDPTYVVSIESFLAWDDGQQRAAPLTHASSRYQHRFTPTDLPWNDLAWRVTRVRGVDPA